MDPVYNEACLSRKPFFKLSLSLNKAFLCHIGQIRNPCDVFKSLSNFASFVLHFLCHMSISCCKHCFAVVPAPIMTTWRCLANAFVSIVGIAPNLQQSLATHVLLAYLSICTQFVYHINMYVILVFQFRARPPSFLWFHNVAEAFY